MTIDRVTNGSTRVLPSLTLRSTWETSPLFRAKFALLTIATAAAASHDHSRTIDPSLVYLLAKPRLYSPSSCNMRRTPCSVKLATMLKRRRICGNKNCDLQGETSQRHRWLKRLELGRVSPRARRKEASPSGWH